MSDGPNYWLILFTGATWQVFRDNGARVVGFRERRWRALQRIRAGDYLLCYLTGVSRFVGLLTVTGAPYYDTTPLWSDDPLPGRLAVKPVVLLDPDTGVPLAELRARLEQFRDRGEHWTAPLRQSPRRWPREDGEQVAEALLQAQIEPLVRDTDERRLRRRPDAFRIRPGGSPTEPVPVNIDGFLGPASHTEIQWLLLSLGDALGLDVWVARNDRGRRFAGQAFGTLPRLLDTLPRQFDPSTMNLIELIDVLWLKRGAILAAFEVECTTTIYSGLLRMADLIALQPNLNIPLYLVAPDARRAKVMRELQRPAFERLDPPLSRVCRYIPFSALRAKYQEVRPLLPYLDPGFIDSIAESCPTTTQSAG
jgi:hypothetical protein